MTAKELVAIQSELDYLWLETPNPNERMLMAALRELHAVIEGDLTEAKRAKKQYRALDPYQ